MKYGTIIPTVNYLKDGKTYWGTQSEVERFECDLEAWQNKEIEDYMERGFEEQEHLCSDPDEELPS